MRALLRSRSVPVLVLAALFSVQAAAQSRPATRPGTTTREQMWFAPTAEDWKKPCLIKWQRTWEDAQAISKETGRALLICVNMDGEIASEHYAGVRYRQPEIAKLYEPYVCVIASVYRHTARDYDEHGQRVLCPRFGSVTCGEHIAIEPLLHDKFFDNRRVAPRHIGVELDGKEMYDIYYAWDTDTIFNGLKDGIANRQNPPPVVKGDRSLVEKVASRDNADRTEVEQAYAQGDAAQKKSLMEAALATGASAPPDLLRLGVFDLDQNLAKLARKGLAQASSEGAVDVIGEALRVPMDTPEKDALVAALARLGENSPRARTLAVVHQGLGLRSDTVDADGWSRELASADSAVRARSARSLSPIAREAAAANARAMTEAKLANRDKALASNDSALLLDLAEASIASAIETGVALEPAQARLTDAREAAMKAEKVGAYGWRPNAAVAVAAYYLGKMDEAYARAEVAVREVATDADSWNAMVVVALFGEMRQKAIVKAIEEKKDWPKQWLTDVHAAYAVLARHPYGDDNHVAVHYDFLNWLGAGGQAGRALEEGLARFPDSDYLHGRLRNRLMQEKGVDGLEKAYEGWLAAPGAAPSTRFFAGLASVRAADYHRRMRQFDAALDAYRRAINHFSKCGDLDADTKGRADFASAIASGSCARIAFEREQWSQALAELLTSIGSAPGAFATPDSFNITAADTARVLGARLKEQKLDEKVAQLEAALAKLDPELLKLPAYERDGASSGPSSRPASRPRRRGQ